MSLRLLPLVLAALFLLACSDAVDEPPVSRSAPPTSTAERRATATATAPPAASTPGAALTPRATPDVTPRAAGTPGGTTGLPESEGGARYDDDCFAGETSALPPAAPLSRPGTAGDDAMPEPYEPLPLVPDKALQALLDGAVGDRSGSYAFVVKDLASGRGALHNADRVFNAASLFKLFVMYAVFEQVSEDAIDWDDELVVTPYYDSFGLSPRVTGLCQVLTVAEAMDAMLSVSDNAAAVLLQDLVGSSNVNAAIEALGLKDSGLFEDGLPVTADDLALLMEAIAVGEAVSSGAGADMVRLLDHDVFENGLIAGVPEGTRVARKTGNWADATHVAGIVFAPWGPYVFVALTSNGYETHVIEALSRTAYEYLAETHGQAD